ncbi:MAG: hypothetical protein KF718_33350 [Polyangiaceae bacterium]|nr:hypothetical protein [Polyangiaceae bacterium]
MDIPRDPALTDALVERLFAQVSADTVHLSHEERFRVYLQLAAKLDEATRGRP